MGPLHYYIFNALVFHLGFVKICEEWGYTPQSGGEGKSMADFTK